MSNLGQNARCWLETVEEWGGEWEAALDICAASFVHSAPFKRSHPDPVKRRKFLDLYFKYLYESEWSNGRASLTCLKRKDEGSQEVEVVYVCCHQIFENRTLEEDLDPLREVDGIGFEICFGQDEWVDKEIHEPMKRAAKELQTTLIYTPFHAVSELFLNQGIGRKYAAKALKQNYHLFVQRLAKEEKLIQNERQPPIVYGVADDIKVRQFQIDINYLELVHLHYNYIPGLKCADDKDYRKGDETSCTFVNVWGPCLRDCTEAMIKKQFLLRSSL